MNGPIVGAWEGEEVGSMLARLGRDSPLKSLWCIAERTRRLDQLLREEGGGEGKEKTEELTLLTFYPTGFPD
jgi:hypothetical protein